MKRLIKSRLQKKARNELKKTIIKDLEEEIKKREIAFEDWVIEFRFRVVVMFFIILICLLLFNIIIKLEVGLRGFGLTVFLLILIIRFVYVFVMAVTQLLSLNDYNISDIKNKIKYMNKNF